MSATGSVSSSSSPRTQSRRRRMVDRLRTTWKGLGINRTVAMLMIKGALPPVIAASMFQSNAVANIYTTLNYLVPVVSIFGFPIMPRARFLQVFLMDLVSVCVAAALCSLMILCAIKAREHTAGPAPPPPTVSVTSAERAPYNSSASVVAGVWLFCNIYMINIVRAKFPQFTFPVIMYSFLSIITATYTPTFPTVAAGLAYVRRIFKTFLTGIGLAGAVSLFIFPVTTRDILFNRVVEFVDALRGTLRAHADYFQAIQHRDMLGRVETYDNQTEKRTKDGKKVYSPEAGAIKAAVRKVTELHSKVRGDLPFAKREVAVGYLGPDDLTELARKLRRVMVPIVGLSATVDIFERLSEYNKWNRPVYDGPEVHTPAVHQKVVHDWNMIMTLVHEPFTHLIDVLDKGLQHALLQLRLVKPPKRPQQDIEAATAAPAPGDEGFAKYLERESDEFYRSRLVTLREWCAQKGVQLPQDYFEQPDRASIEIPDDWPGDRGRLRNERQLYILLFMEHLLYTASRAVLELVQYADDRAASGKLKRKRLVIPGNKQVRKWVQSMFQVQDSHGDEGMGDLHDQGPILYLGQAYSERRDPEHLPAETRWERAGEALRRIPAFLRSADSAFAFRVACATISVFIINLLAQTQRFFVHQRLQWGLVMVAISMTPTAGQSIASFALRIAGTVIAAVFSLLVWYIPDGHTPGVIIFLFLYNATAFYIPVQKPHLLVMGLIGIVTTNLIVGYELEVKKIGLERAAANGQVYYPIYLLAPYRLAVVAGGLAVAFIWTVFPFPISEHSVLRKNLGAALYLLANYYSIMHETVTARARGDEGDMTLKTSAGRRLEKARHKVYTKMLLTINSLHTYANFLKWEVHIGGRFPKRQYETIMACMQNMVNYITLIEHASRTFTQPPSHTIPNIPSSDPNWHEDFKNLVATANFTTQQVTSILALLSASIATRQPLPPHLRTPRPYVFMERLKELDKDILSIRHAAEPGYAAFAVLHVSTRCLIGDLEKLVENVRALVGELDFSFHVVSTRVGARGSSTDMTTAESEGEGRQKQD